MTGPYDDMIHLPHHVSPRRPRMPLSDRAAQFSPFAALTGYEEVIAETARLTGAQRDLSEDEIAALDAKLRLLAAHIDEHPAAAVTWFRPDGRKAGGAYVVTSGRVKKVDLYEQTVVFCDGPAIPIGAICGIELTPER